MMEGEEEIKYRLKYRHCDAEGESVLNEVETVRLNCIKFSVFAVVCIMLAGIPLLLVHWFPRLKKIFYYDHASLQESDHVCILNFDQSTTICQIQEEEVNYDEQRSQRRQYFINRYLKYVITEGVVQALVFDGKARIKRITTAQNETGLSNIQVQHLRGNFGKGAIQIERPTWYEILLKEMIRPLYLFLFFSVALWMYEEYIIYASIILGTSLVAIFLTVYQLLTLNIKIHQMAYYQVRVNVLREGQVRDISSVEVVPGDIVFLKEAIKIPFEGVIIQGSVLINECALTGESVPVVKKADVMENYRSAKHSLDKSAFVFEGTTIVQVNSKKKMAQFESYREAYGIPVCVTRTNFTTLKGQLIRIILFPKEQQNIFQRESAKFLLVLFAIAVITYIGMIPKLQEVITPHDLVIKFLDLITITVPPALPVSMAFGVIYAIEKLKKKIIFCIEENRVIVGGVVNFCCFDKTGTLTEDFMDFQALVPAHKGRFQETIKNRANRKAGIEGQISKHPYLFDIFNNMASNHSIIKIEQSNQLIGDPMEIKLFQFGSFSLNQSNSDPQVIFSFESQRKQEGMVFRRFQFDSDLQRMSVVARVKVGAEQGEQLWAYAKGSPEMMATIMEKDTIPHDYNKVLAQYASNGFRVLAIASKRIPGNDFKSITRQQAEAGLIFNGFEVFQNKLKPETTAAIRELKEAQIGVVMITGDNSLTGSNIGYKCGISYKDRGMLIVDYKEGKFTEEEFIYRERGDETDIKENTRMSLEGSQERNSNLLEQSILSPNKVKLPPIQLDSIAKPQAPTENPTNHKIANQMLVQGSQIDLTEDYLRKIIGQAKQSNHQLCITGNAFNKLFQGKVQEISEMKRELLDLTTVYARTKPNDKAKIVMVYQHTGKTVSMCGDGANDCGALKQADIGLSLSQAEASISAPFTSQITNISSMVELIKQCRAGLATNFSLFNIMAIYSLTQYTSSIINQLYYCYPADLHYLYWDIACNFFFVVFVGYTQTAQKLSVAIPNNSLLCFTNLFQVLFAFGVNVLGQISIIVAISTTYATNVDYSVNGGFDNNKALYLANEDFSSDSPESSVLFLFSNFIYLFTLLAFNIGGPWRKPVFTNIPIMVIFVLVFVYTCLIVVVTSTRLEQFYVLYINEQQVCGFILGIGVMFGVVIYCLQKLVWEPLSIWLRKTYPEKTWL